MKIAVTGKGGVGKTVFSAALSLYLIKENKKVITLDCDPDSNLLATLGYEQWKDVPVISENKKLIKERTKNDDTGFYILNPEVSDVFDKYVIKFRGIDILIMGKVKKAEDGCYCAENTFTKNLVRHIMLKKDEFVIMDMEAGIEHLTRGTSKYIDVSFIIAEPQSRAIETAERIIKLTEELNLRKIFLVGNKITDDSDIKFLKESSEKLNINLAGFIRYSDDLKKNSGVISDNNEIINDIEKIYNNCFFKEEKK